MSLHWVGRNKMTCTNETCIKYWKELVGDEEEIVRKVENMTSSEYRGLTPIDHDFIPFHCTESGCHDVSLGKTSFPCEYCMYWVCQDHAVTYKEETYHKECKRKVQHTWKRKQLSPTSSVYTCKKCDHSFTHYHPVMVITPLNVLNREINQACVKKMKMEN